MPRAYTRAVSPRLAECQLTHLERTPIDATKAAAQHSAYEAALCDAGFEIVRLPELADDPDAVFVEDTALLLDGHAIMTRPGAASRIGEVDSTATGLANHFELHRVERGHVDGGDVLRIGKRLYVGLSTRTNSEGIAALAELVRPFGFEVAQAELRDCLHLKTGATFAGKGILLQSRRDRPGAVRRSRTFCRRRAGRRQLRPRRRPADPSRRQPAHRGPSARARLHRHRGRRLGASEGGSRGHLHEPDRRPLAVHRLHAALVVALAGGCSRRQDFIKPLQVLAA